MSVISAFVPPEAPTRIGSAVVDVGSDIAVSIERADSARLAELDAHWRDLVARAYEPNVFMNPAVVRLGGSNAVTLLAWNSDEKLIGLWAFANRAGPLRVLQSPSVPHAYLATPVVDRAAAKAALGAMLDYIAVGSTLPKLISLESIRSDGPTMQALAQVLAERRSAPCFLEESRRPILASTLDAKQYFEQALSASSRKKLRQHRRRLEEKGGLERVVFTEPAAVCRAFEDFLRLEAAGWKGRRGTALLSRQSDADFARAMIAALAAQGDASVHALHQNGKVVASQVVLRAGPVAFTWKTTYDESLGEFSPGMLLLEDYTAAFLADKTIAQVDSCAVDDSGFMSAWSEREQIAHILIDTRRGGSPSFRVVAGLQKMFLALRAQAKNLYVSRRRRWKGH